MNIFSGYELLWLFFSYSFLGWVLETVTATLRQRKFSNRGLVNGPFCVMYAITAVLISVGLQELTGFWLFWYSMIYATVNRVDRRSSYRDGFQRTLVGLF